MHLASSTTSQAGNKSAHLGKGQGVPRLLPTTRKGVRMSTTLYKGVQNSTNHRQRIISNLTDAGNRLTTYEVIAGTGWYLGAENLARRFARKYGCTKHQAAGVIAAMSPNQTWANNIIMAEQALAGNPRGFSSAVARVQRILAGGSIIGTFPEPTGNSHKIREFYRAISGNANAVVVDRWALRAAWPNYESSVHDLERVGVYAMVADCYREVAALFDMEPRDFQAAIWIQVRGSHE